MDEPDDFKTRWAVFAAALDERSRRLNGNFDAEPARWHILTVAELRRMALEWFSWGCVHQAATRDRLAELLPEEQRAKG